MPSTLTALALLLVAVVPGAVALTAYEHAAGRTRGDSNDRIVRFVVATALLAPVVVMFAWLFWRRVLHVPNGAGGFRNVLRDGQPSAWWTLAPPAYITAAASAGWIAGSGRERWMRWRMSRRSNRNAPRGTRPWDMLFAGGDPSVVACRLRDGRAVGGLFGGASFASYGSAAERELVLERAYQVDEDATVLRDEQGVPLDHGQGGRVHIREADILFIRIEELGATVVGDATTPTVPEAPVAAPEGYTGGPGRQSERRVAVIPPDARAPSIEQTFSGTKAAQIVGITYRQLDFWARTDLVRPTLIDTSGSGTRRAYTYRDLLELRTLKNLLDAGITLESVREIFTYLRTSISWDMANAHLVISGDQVVLCDGDAWIDLVRRGEGVLSVLPLATVKDEVDAALVELRPESAFMPAELVTTAVVAAFESAGWVVELADGLRDRGYDLVVSRGSVTAVVDVRVGVASLSAVRTTMRHATDEVKRSRRFVLAVLDRPEWRELVADRGSELEALGVVVLFVSDDLNVVGLDAL